MSDDFKMEVFETTELDSLASDEIESDKESEEDRRVVGKSRLHGKIPSDWKATTVNDVVESMADGGTPSRAGEEGYFGGEINWVVVEDVEFEIVDSREKLTEKGLEASSATLWPEGSVILTTGASIGNVGVAMVPTATKQGITGMVPKHTINSHFLARYLEANGPLLNRYAQGTTIQEIRPYLLRKVELPCPPLPEQRKIASVLYTVDQAIHKTETIIEQAKRVKRGMRQDLLSSGIGKSGVLRSNRKQSFDTRDEREWGEIPQSWDFKDLGKLCSVQAGYAFKSDWYREEGKVRVLRGANVGYGAPDWSDERHLESERVSEYSDYRLEEGDIIIGMDRPLTQLGFKISRISEADLPALLVQRVGRFFPEDCNPDYLYVLLNDWRYQKQVIRRGQGMDIPHISKSDILAPKVPVPPLDEQRRIAKVYRNLLRKIEGENNLLDSYQRLKKGLMQDLLTGEVRTADKAIGVLDEVEAHG